MNARKVDESYTEYKARRTTQNSQIKKYLQYGVLLWNSAVQGTYKRAKHGPLTRGK